MTISRRDVSLPDTMALLTTDDNEERLRAHLVSEAIASSDIRRMTIEEFRALPARLAWTSDEAPFTSLVIVPREEGAIHESGYRMLDFVGVRRRSPICRLSGGSDALQVPEVGRWEMDCLPVSGLLHLWCNTHLIVADSAFSTFTLKCVPHEPR